MSKTVKSNITLFSCAIIWGTAFVAQRAGMSDIQPFYFSALRMLIGALALVPIFMIGERREKRALAGAGLKTGNEIEDKSRNKYGNKYILKGGVICGIVIFFGANMQQVGIVYTSAGKTAFITTLYIVIVPLMSIVLKHRPNLFNWIGAALGTVGLYFLSIKAGFTIAGGDLIILIGAFFWAAHILLMDHFAPKVNVAKLVCIQFAVAGIISLLVAIFTEHISMEAVVKVLPSVLYVGVMSTAIAFTLQALGQKNANPTVASIILSTESLFGAISGYIILNEILSQREIFGCILMFGAVIIAQLPPLKRKRNELK